MKFSEIDRFTDQPTLETTLANIAVILYERLGCQEEETKDFILQKLLDIKSFDRTEFLLKPNATLVVE